MSSGTATESDTDVSARQLHVVVLLSFHTESCVLRETGGLIRLVFMTDEAFAQLFPNLSEAQLNEAKENLDQYIVLAWEIWEDEQSTLTAE